jgi:hypothetical protein
MSSIVKTIKYGGKILKTLEDKTSCVHGLEELILLKWPF